MKKCLQGERRKNNLGRIDMENKYAPVMIPTLCRYEHLKRCIESLQMNSWAKYTDLYIGLDYPAKESHIDGYGRHPVADGTGGFHPSVFS